LKIKYKSMVIFANFFFPQLVIKILKNSLHFWGNFSPVEKESAFKVCTRSLLVIKILKSSLHFWGNFFASRKGVCHQGMHKIWVFVEESRVCDKSCIQLFDNIFMWNNQTPANCSTIWRMRCILLSASTNDASHALHMELTCHLFVRYLPSTQEKWIGDFYTGTKL
jgi:hypothetical protein